MSDQDNQPDYQKIDKLLQEIENKTQAEKKIIIDEFNQEISKQLTEEGKKV